MSDLIHDLQYSEKSYKDIEVILKTTPFIDQLDAKELRRYMVWINERYAERGEKDETLY